MFYRAGFVLVVCCSLAMAQSSGPSARLFNETDAATTRKRIAEAQQKLHAGKAAEAADELQRILEEAGDDLVPVEANQFQPARRLVHRYLAALPPDVLKAFQNRLEEPAKKLLDLGTRKRDAALLRQLIDRYYVSRPAEAALDLLAELQLERGEFRAAESTWRELLPPGSELELAYPGAKADPAAVRAKILLAAIFAGDVDRSRAMLIAFQKEHPNATGRLAGIDGLYHETLAKLVANPPELRTGRDTAGWSAFGGNANRDGAADRNLPRWNSMQPTWKTAWPPRIGEKSIPRPASIPAAKSLAFHPVVLDGTVYIADAGRIAAFDLKTGFVRIAYEFRTPDEPITLGDADTNLPNGQGVDFTLTVNAGRIYARFGNAAWPTNDAKVRSRIVVLAPISGAEPKPGGGSLKMISILSPPIGLPGRNAWDDAPLAVDGRLYAPCTRVDERGRWIHSVACYDDPPQPKPLWVTDVAESDSGVNRTRRGMLTLAGVNVVLTLPQGMIASLDRGTGKLAWAFRGPPPQRPVNEELRPNSNPAVYSNGRIVFAPPESDALYSLDANSGRVLWQVAPIRVDHLIGVVGTRAIVTIAGPQKGIRAYDVASGSDGEPLGWRNHDDPMLASYGRGILFRDAVLWPTREKLYALSPDDGSVLRQALPLPHGNLAYADGVLLAVTTTAIWGYVLNSEEPVVAPIPKLVPMRTPPAFVPGPKAIRTNIPPVDWPTELRLGARRELTPEAWLLDQSGEPVATALVCDGNSVVAWPADLSKPLWRTSLAIPARLTRTRRDGDRWIVWGNAAIVTLAAADGAFQWRFDAPAHSIDSLAVFGSRVLAALGPRCWLALDLASGQIAWLKDTLGRNRYRPFNIESSPSFAPVFAAVGDAILVQKSDGERWTLELESGRVRHISPTTFTPWTVTPATLDSGTVVVPESAGTVAAIDPRNDRALWRFDAGRPASWSGKSPQTVLLGDAVYVLIARNAGKELHRLDPKTGETLWRTPALLSGEDANLGDLREAGESIYLDHFAGVSAIARGSGRILWQRELEIRGPRQLIASRSGVVVNHFQSREVDGSLWLRRLAEWPAPKRILGSLFTLFEAVTRGTTSLIRLDADSGEIAGRADFEGWSLQRVARLGDAFWLFESGGARPLRGGR